MVGTVHVPLNWATIKWLPEEKWVKDVAPKLSLAGLDIKNISRSVYVIRLNGDIAVEYEWGQSPVVYVGEGNFVSRIASHKTWVNEIRDLVGEFDFEVCVATPRVKNNGFAYLDAEAALLERFGELYGTAPLWNKQFETRRCEHYQYSSKQLNYALRQRSGMRYKWAIRPMRSSSFFDAYEKTARLWDERSS